MNLVQIHTMAENGSIGVFDIEKIPFIIIATTNRNGSGSTIVYNFRLRKRTGNRWCYH